MKNKSDLTSSGLPLSGENYVLLGIGFLIIILGFLLMAGGGSTDPNVFNEEELFSFRRTTLAPMIVLFGFIFEIWAIMKKPKKNPAE
ncbi:MAG: DUF3098 domain-containing protein [Bacteroidales bacterium]|nr:DUF3098 domain-containing protein [Bacteroidales bacterium]MCF8391315.1 DUF3098 domain-containing protein [Bacteroidales bacterium]